MPRVAKHLAVAAKDTIASLWSMALSEGSITIFPKTESDCYNIRNKLYAYRSRERRRAREHTGADVCAYDSLKPTYGPVSRYPGLLPAGIHEDAWFLSITRDDIVEVLVPRTRQAEHLDAPVDDFVYVVKPTHK